MQYTAIQFKPGLLSLSKTKNYNNTFSWTEKKNTLTEIKLTSNVSSITETTN